MSDTPEFLGDRTAREWSTPKGTSLGPEPAGAWSGRDARYPLEVALATAEHRPRADDVRKLWKARHGNVPNPLLVLVAYPEGDDWKASICGPAGDEPPVEGDLDIGQVERLADAALNEPTRHAAIRFLSAMWAELETELPGLRNAGMLASHELRDGVPLRADWASLCDRGRPLLDHSGRELVQHLGFTIEPGPTSASVLEIAETKRAVAVFLDEGEEFEQPGDRFGATSPVSYALALADREGLPWVVATRGRQIRVYSARPDIGVGRKGRAETYIEANLALLPDDRAGYVPLLFSAEALVEEGTFDQVLEGSRDYAADLGVRLRDRVYEHAVPALAMALAARHTGELNEDALGHVYEQALTVLFRLLFVAYAEDKDLLPYRFNGAYREHALKTRARDLAGRAAKGTLDFDEHATDLWDETVTLWLAVDKGNTERGVPAYNGGLFSSDSQVSSAGAALSAVRLTNAEFGPALVAMLVDEADDVPGPVDFRSLSVREFGTIYEGLLESRLSVAPSDLTLDAKSNYVPAQLGDDAAVRAGSVYFHNRSGARKSSGSYFTKPFAVEHLLDHALEPALDDHLARVTERLDADEEAKAADAFFDFRCVDLAMGSGHFLVAAVDRIEARLSGFLALRPIPQVVAELDRLRVSALQALGPLGVGAEIEHASLLRRQVARRCIYGVDVNPIAVELARLGIWIHTFVPGLPLSFLDHSLVRGDSLTGIGSLDEAIEALDPEHAPGQASLFRDQIEGVLGRAEHSLERLARISEASKAEIDSAREAQRDAEEAVAPARDLFDLIVAGRLGEAAPLDTFDQSSLEQNVDVPRAREFSAQLQAIHFPIVFPEVFLRERPGFDCIVGNPPWEKMMFKTDVFWALRFPGLKALPVARMNEEIGRLRSVRPDLALEEVQEQDHVDKLREALLSGPYPELQSGHVDLYKAFAWRMLALSRRQGFIGVVLPRSALSALGSAGWRDAVFEAGGFADLTTLINSRGWVFDDAEHRYTIALTTIATDPVQPPALRMRGPYASLRDYLMGMKGTAFVLDLQEFRKWSPRGVFPLLPTTGAGSLFLKIQEHPPLNDVRHGWRFRPIQGDFNSTSDKKFMLFGDTERSVWPVYGGKSFNLWLPDTGEYYAAADPEAVQAELFRRRASGSRNARSAFSELSREIVQDRDTLPCLHPRISYRKIVRSTDSRTVIASLIPPRVITTTANPYLLRVRGDERDEAYLLGVISSIPFDWIARRYVEINLDFHLLNAFPLPLRNRDHEHQRLIEANVRALVGEDGRYALWASRIPTISGASRSSEVLVAQIDAAVARLYGFDEDDLRVIFETFHEGWDYRERFDDVVREFESLRAA